VKTCVAEVVQVLEEAPDDEPSDEDAMSKSTSGAPARPPQAFGKHSFHRSFDILTYAWDHYPTLPSSSCALPVSPLQSSPVEASTARLNDILHDVIFKQ